MRERERKREQEYGVTAFYETPRILAHFYTDTSNCCLTTDK